jgi:integrase
MAEGIDTRHSRSCASRAGTSCTCTPSYQAHVWSKRDGKRIRKTFPTLAAARTWRTDAKKALQDGKMRAPTPMTLREAGELVVAGMKDGSVRKRSGERYKPSVIRGYEDDLRKYVFPELGACKLSEIQDVDVQEFADMSGLGPSRRRNVLMPVRAIYRYALRRRLVMVNPTTGLELPAVGGTRDRIASPSEAEKLLAAVPEDDRSAWATAFYAGLRAGELQALRWEDVDLANGVIHVRHSWDRRDGLVAPKSKKGERRVPIPAVLRDYLVTRKLRAGGTGFVFGGASPFSYFGLCDRTKRAWRNAKLEPITLHECRHTFASLMIAAGVNAKALSSYMGHSSVTITYDRYGHLMPGNEGEAAGLLDAYLAAQRERADQQARQAMLRDNRATVGDIL